jgi:hypothetical protein
VLTKKALLICYLGNHPSNIKKFPKEFSMKKKLLIKQLGLSILLVLTCKIGLVQSSESPQVCDSLIVSLKDVAQSLTYNTIYCNSITYTGPRGSRGYQQYYTIVASSAKLQDAYNRGLGIAKSICPEGALMSDLALTGLHQNGIELHIGEIPDGSLLNTCH